MQPNDARKFKTLMQGVFDFYRQGLTEFTLNIWWKAMQSFEFEAISDAFNLHCANPDVGQFPPMPADVIRMMQGSTQDAALVAWAKVDRAVREKGTYYSVVFDDALIHRVIYEMGGWIRVGNKSEKEWPFVRNEWINRYRGYRMRNEIPSYPSVLIGMTEAENKLQGWESGALILIGDTKTARLVLAGGTNMALLDFTPLSLISTDKVRIIAQKAVSIAIQKENYKGCDKK